MGKTENIELRVKGKEIHDNHIGALKLFGTMNEILIEQSKESSKFNYRKCLGDTVYKSKSIANNDAVIKIKEIKFISSIRESNLFESLNIVLELKQTKPLTYEIAINQLLFMSGINNIFSNLLHTSTPKEKIQAVADILVFYHTCLLKGRTVLGNTYTLNTSDDVSCDITCVGDFVFDVHMTRTIQYSSIIDISHDVPEPISKPKFSIGGFGKRKQLALKEDDIWTSAPVPKIKEEPKIKEIKKSGAIGVLDNKGSLTERIEDIQMSAKNNTITKVAEIRKQREQEAVQSENPEDIVYSPINVPETPNFKEQEPVEKAFVSMDSPKEKVMSRVAKSIESQKTAIKEYKEKVEENLDNQIAAIKARRAQEDLSKTQDLSSLKNYLDDMDSDGEITEDSSESEIDLNQYIL